MKTKDFKKKLVLNKKTVANLENNDMGVVKGGCDISYLSCSTLPAKCTYTDLCTQFEPCYLSENVTNCVNPRLTEDCRLTERC
jgi:hypothetical protein